MRELLKKYVLSAGFIFIGLIWVIGILTFSFGFDFHDLATHPLDLTVWYSGFTGALLHGDWGHLINNTYPLLVLWFFILIQFERYNWIVFISTYFLSGLLVWLFARSNVYHIGASGVVYAWAAFLAASGFFRKNRMALAIGLIVAFLYGGMIWGVFPVQEGVSWDGHLYGAIAGVILAVVFRNLNKPPKELKNEDLEDEEFDLEKYGDGGFEYLRRKRPIDSSES